MASVTKKTAPFGTWKSPITTELLTSSSIKIGDFRALGKNDLYYIESRPSEKGRSVLVKKDGEGNNTEVVNKDANVRSRVHEYGGASFTVHKDFGVVYSHFADNRLYSIPDLSDPSKYFPITPEGVPLRFADFEFHPTEKVLVSVCEDHTVDEPSKVKNYLVQIELDENSSIKTIAEGADFYSNPRFSQDGKKFIWTEFNLPEMSWSSSKLFLADYEKGIKNSKQIAGTADRKKLISISQPRWFGDRLVFASNESGYWNLYTSDLKGNTKPLTEALKNDFSEPDWILGNSTYVDIPESKSIIAKHTSSEGLTLISKISEDGQLESIEHPFLTIDHMRSNPAFPELVYIAGSTKTQSGLFSFYCRNGDVKLIQDASATDISPEYLSVPVGLKFPTKDGSTCYGFYYPPTSADYESSGSPPTLVRVHGGPTGFSAPASSAAISYWTSRGFAFFNLNYRGSAGFGKDYIKALDSNWGVADTDDAIFAAKYLIDNEYSNEKLAIDGGSAGGFTVLNVMCHSTIFSAGIALYGVSDCKALAEDTHKFESQYLFNLVGGTPEEVPQVYHDRSPIYFAAKIKTPLLVLQGQEDKIVPVDQAVKMVDAVKAAGNHNVEIIIYPGEGHGFRGKEAVMSSIENEERFLLKYLVEK